MIITNKRNWSQGWIEADKRLSDDYDRVGWLSCTSLVESIRITLLRQRHWDELTEDISSRVWLTLGSAVHLVMERGNKTGMVEERFLIDVSGRQISMKPDRVDLIAGTNPAEFCLRDFKTCQTFALKKGKFSWIAQTNSYKFGLCKLGVNVTQIIAEALLKDWKWSEWNKHPREYPDAAAQAVPIQVWSQQQCLEYLERRVGEYEAAWDLADADLPLCTPDERWQRPSRYAVMKPGAKKALRVYDTREEAERECPGGYNIVDRPGEDVRCDRDDSFGDPMYCSCRKWCPYWAGKQGIAVAEPQEF